MTNNFKNNTFADSLFSGAAAIALIAGVGIAATPAQAGTLGWSDGATDFFDDVNLGPGDTFSVTFSPDVTDPAPGLGSALISTASGEFAGPFNVAPPSSVELLTPATATFNWVSGTDTTPGAIFSYDLDGPLTFAFNNGATITWAEDTLFEGTFDNDNGVGFVEAEESAPPTVTGIDPFDVVTADDFVFEDIQPSGGATYGASVSVVPSTPEPTTILGLLAIGGLGLGLKRKKQSKQLSA